MKKFFPFLIAALFCAIIASCSDSDNLPAPSSGEPYVKTPFHEKLPGVWRRGGILKEGQYIDKLAQGEEEIWMLDPKHEIAEIVFLRNSAITNNEYCFYADAKEIVLIDTAIIHLIEKEIEKLQLSNDVMPTIDFGEQSFLTSAHTYRMINDDSLAICTKTSDSDSIVSYFGRMHDLDAEWQQEIVEQTFETRGLLNDIFNGVKKFINNVCDTFVRFYKSIKGYAEYTSSASEFNKPWENNTGWTYTSWMSCLNNPDLPIGELCIPGAHDAATGYIASLGVRVNADCQDKTFEEMLDAGVRYFDLRPALAFTGQVVKGCVAAGLYPKEFEVAVPELLILFHGPLPCFITYDNVINILVDFVTKHPGEFVVISSSYENTLIKLFDTKKISIQLFHKKQLVRNGTLIPYRPDMKLSEARGHVLVINEDAPDDDNLRFGTYVENIFSAGNYFNKFRVVSYDNADRGAEFVYWKQNEYEMKPYEKDKAQHKMDGIKAIADRTQDSDMSKIAFNNQLNANTGNFINLQCDYYAQVFNHYVYELFRENMEKGAKPYRGGFYSMDYAGSEDYSRYIRDIHCHVYGEAAVWAIIERNFNPNGR